MVFYERKDRPGLTHILGSLRGAAAAVAEPAAPVKVVLSVTAEGVLVSSGAKPKMDGTTLVYKPTPAMADSVMTIS